MEKFCARKIAEIIIRMRVGGVSQQEREYLLRWMDQSEYNRQAYRNIISGNSLKDRLQIEQSIADNSQLEEIVSKIANRIEFRQRVKSYSVVASVLAGVVVLVLFLFPLFNSKEQRDTKPTADLVSQELDFANSKVKLITGKGDVVNLASGGEAKIDLVEKLLGEHSAEHGVAGNLVGGIDANFALEVELTNTIVTEAGGEIVFLLADGSKVWLNALSKLEFPTKFSGKTREVWLSGEAYFEVVGNKNAPFIVHSKNHSVKVLGTTFNIKAYSDEDDICTTLFEGKVAVETPGSQETILIPGMESLYNSSNSKITTRAADLDVAAAWRTGHFFFENSDIDKILKVLSRWYGVAFYNKSTGTHTFMGRFSKYNSLESTLESIRRAGGPSYEISTDGATVILKN